MDGYAVLGLYLCGCCCVLNTFISHLVYAALSVDAELSWDCRYTGSLDGPSHSTITHQRRYRGNHSAPVGENTKAFPSGSAVNRHR
jgi:hypothetical protein